MKLDCTVITAHENPFMVVIVPKPILNNTAVAQQTIQFLEQRYFHMPTVLMTRDDRGVPNAYYGRGDLALHLLQVPLTAVPWQQVALDVQGSPHSAVTH